MGRKIVLFLAEGNIESNIKYSEQEESTCQLCALGELQYPIKPNIDSRMHKL